MNLIRFIGALRQRLPLVVCDNTNIEPWEYAAYIAAAEALGYRVELRCVSYASDEAFVAQCAARNRHGVPAERLIDMARRLKDPER